VRDPFPCSSQLETILGLARKGLNSADVTVYTAMEKHHIIRSFERLEAHLRKRGMTIEPTVFPPYGKTAKGWKGQGWRLPHGRRTEDRAGIHP
jgi:hypothetical protein